MLDGSDARLQAVLNGPRAIGMSEHIGADRAGGLDRGGELVD